MVMKIEDQVCSFDLSKRLDKLGVNQDSLFYWICDLRFYRYSVIYKEGSNINLGNILTSAFTAAELGALIPPKHYNFYKNDEGYVFSLFGEPNTFDKNLANAIAKMLIYLIENGLINVNN